MSSELKIGLAIVAAAILFVLGVRFLAGMPLFGGHATYYTSFQDTQGMLPGAAVRVNGVKVGAVKDLQLIESERRVRVTFSADDDVALPQGTHTGMSGMSFFGNLHITLTLASADNPAIEPGAFIPSTDSPSGDLLANLTERAPGLMAQTDTLVTTASQTMRELNVMLTQPNSDLRRTLEATRSAAVTMRNIMQEQRATLSHTLANFESASTDLNRIIETNDDSLEIAIARFSDSSRRLNETLTGVQRTSDRLDRILLALEEQEGTLGMLLYDPSLYVHLDSAAVEMNQLLADFKRRPGFYLEHMRLVDIF